MWTVVDHDINPKTILVRVQATIDVDSEQSELRDLIASLQKRLKDSPDADQSAARPVTPAGTSGAAEAPAEAATES